MIITIDGPTASGKSSIAKKLAQRLGIHCLNTGLLYRAVAYLLDRFHGASFWQDKTLFALAPQDIQMINQLSYEYDHGIPRIFFKERDITSFLASEQVSQHASMVSSCMRLRECLLPLQRNIAEKYDLIADGRDCGSVVFPQADIKFYLTARPEVRASRRFADYQEASSSVDFDTVVASLKERDARDMQRKTAPLVIPSGAVVIDSSDMTINETIDAFMSVIRSHTSCLKYL